MHKQLACMTDQVTDTKSGTQSDLFTDCVQIALLVYNLTIGQMSWSVVHQPGPDGGVAAQRAWRLNLLFVVVWLVL